MKKFLLIGAAVLILILLLAVLIPFVVDLNKYKETILAQIEPYVPREVDFDHVELTLLTGVGAEIRGFRMAENPLFGPGDFLRLKSLNVRIRLLPLLSREIKVSRIILNEPVVHVVRNEEGVFNFSDLVGGEEEPEGVPAKDEAPAPSPEATAAGPGALAWLLVNDLEVRNATVSYQDHTLFPQAPPLVVHALDLSVQDLSLTTPLKLRLDAGLFEGRGQNLHLKGVVGPVGKAMQMEAIPVDLSGKLGPVSWDALPPPLTEPMLQESPYRILSASLRMDLEVGGTLQDGLRTRSAWHLDDVVVQRSQEEGPPTATEKMQLAFVHEALLDHPAQSLEIASAQVSLNANRVLLRGSVQDYLDTARWDLELWTEGLDPGALSRLLPVLGVALPPDLQLTGPAEIKVRTNGTMDSLRVDAEADMDRLGVQLGDTFRKVAGVPFSMSFKGSKDGDRITVGDLRLHLYQLVVNASGEVVTGEPTRFGLLAQSPAVDLKGWGSLVPAVSDYQPHGSVLLRMSARGTTEDASMNLQLSSDRIGFRLPPKPGEPPPAGDGAGTLASLSLEAQARKRGEQVETSGTLNIGRGEILAVPFERFLSRAALSDDRADLTGLELSVFGGTVRGSGRYGTKTGEWSFRPELRDIAVEEVLDKLTEYKNMFSGRLSGTFQAEGRVVDEGQAASPTVTGSFRLARGELKNFNLVGDVLQALLNLQDVAKFLGGVKGEVSEHASTRFGYLDGTFRFQNEILTLDPLHFHDLATSRSTDSDAVFTGSVALDTDLLDLKGRVILSPRDSASLAREADVLRALLDSEGRMVFPLTLKGRIQKPVPFLDTQYVVGAITRYYARKGLDKLQKQLGLPPGDAEPAEKPVEDLLRRLFR